MKSNYHIFEGDKQNEQKKLEYLTEQAENACPLRASCQQPPLFILHLPGPLAASPEETRMNGSIIYTEAKEACVLLALRVRENADNRPH